MRILAQAWLSRWAIAVIGGVAGIGLLAVDAEVGGQEGQAEVYPAALQEIRAIHQDMYTRVSPPDVPYLRGGNVTASFVVTYTGFTPQAQAAFQAAVDVWANIVASPVTIVVNANFVALGPGILGSAGPGYLIRDFPGAPEANTFYPAGLANARAGFDLQPTLVDINSNFSSVFANWYFGTDGNTPPGQFDFMSVVLHELGHGLGFLGTATVGGGIGSWGITQTGITRPASYDLQVVNGSLQALTNIVLFPNPSAALATQLQSNNLLWNGPLGIAGNGGMRPKLYAPPLWEQGSSYSHLDEATYPAGNPNSLMTPQIGTAEAIHNPGSITVGLFVDIGWLTGPQCTFTLSPLEVVAPQAGVSTSLNVTTQPGCAWTAETFDSFINITTASGTGDGTINFIVSANSGVEYRDGFIDLLGPGGAIADFAYITQNGTGPILSLTQTTLNFGAVTSDGGMTFSAQTPDQIVRMTQAGAGTVTWFALPLDPWITVTPLSGGGPAVFTIGVKPDVSLPPPVAGANNAVVPSAILILTTGAGNQVPLINVNINLVTPAQTANPTGNIDTPANNATGLSGAVGFTGWAIDDIGIANVVLCRDAVPPEMAPIDGRCGGTAKIYVGDAVSIDGARPDVQAAFPTFPQNSSAGWGFMVLTNMLPNQGNGTYVFSVYLFDRDAHAVLLGTRTITCNNAASTLPFGTIDTPGQGAIASGAAYFNFGWALTPQPKIIPFDGSTIVVFVDSLPIGNPSYNHFRADIAGLFPGFANSGGAVGVRTLNTTTMTNGLHIIAWSVTDNMGALTGIGSRFFTVSNAAGSPERDAPRGVSQEEPGEPIPASAPFIAIDPLQLNALPTLRDPVEGRLGWDLDAPFDPIAMSRSGRATVNARVTDRVELRLGQRGTDDYTGFVRVGSGLSPLPIGSHLDATTGVFSWSPGAGFIGSYDLVFVGWSGRRPMSRREVRVILHAPTGGREEPVSVSPLPIR